LGTGRTDYMVMSTFPTPAENDPAHFLQIAAQGAGLSTHADLWRWLQGDVQAWLSHDVMLVGWGDFRSGELHFDIVSSIPGMRSNEFTRTGIAPLMGYLRDCWVAARQLPCQLDMSGCARLLGQCGYPSREALARMQTALVHGFGDGNRGERIFAALSAQPCLPAGSGPALKLLLPFIDVALRRIPPTPSRQARCDGHPVAPHELRLADLSERERQIMTWVAMGKTNPEIGCILRISEFTVKNHMKSIFSKLDVSNRAQAVATLTRIDAHA
jgi:transcriptional regulator EpsA